MAADHRRSGIASLFDELRCRNGVKRHDNPVRRGRRCLMPDVLGNRNPAILNARGVRRQALRAPRGSIPRLKIAGAAERVHALSAVWMPLGARVQPTPQDEHPGRADGRRQRRQQVGDNFERDSLIGRGTQRCPQPVRDSLERRTHAMLSRQQIELDQQIAFFRLVHGSPTS